MRVRVNSPFLFLIFLFRIFILLDSFGSALRSLFLPSFPQGTTCLDGRECSMRVGYTAFHATAASLVGGLFYTEEASATRLLVEVTLEKHKLVSICARVRAYVFSELHVEGSAQVCG